ncbi:uncharacterized protein LOC110853428 isoform X2 [Folsomia candida]|uniref:Phospholipid scramblase n=1 Tax=Folsomia candida TaxID=158441 RepID=A0A226E1H6_FOLCA|nr:uncharacterized protein LOC110853428 isoform X2 [Folsomia candida]OXA51309.1 hypothetical protein Fcan01_14107 [Folsomia candida]
MAAKFWFVANKPKRESEIEPENFSSSELVPIYKFLSHFKKLQRQLPVTVSPSLSTRRGGNETEKLGGLGQLEFHQDFELGLVSSGLCGMTKHYEITTGKDRHLFSASPENSSICGCFSQDFDNVVITDLQNVPILEIQKIEFSGYLSTKLNFNVILLPCGTKIGEISRIAGFLERPKYEINDAQDGPLFNLVLDSRTNLLRNPNYVLGKRGKTAFCHQTDHGSYQLKIYHFCSTEEKALLLSLILILDLVNRNK